VGKRLPSRLSAELLCLFVIIGSLTLSPIRVAATTSFPSVVHSGTMLSITNSLITSQFDLSRSAFTISYPQDREQQFRLRISFIQLMEVTSPNQTTPSQILDSVSLASATWYFTQLENASEVQFGPNFQGQIYATIPLQRGGSTYAVNVSLILFSSLRQNETTIVTSDFWVASEPVGGPIQTNLDLRITGWPFRTLADSLVLRMFVDGSQGTVSHRGEFSATELFNTVAIVNDVTQRQDASINWLRRAVIDNGTKISADVTLNTFSNAGGLRVDLYYPSFTAAALTHNLLLETSSAFQAAGFVPLQLATPLAGAATLFILTLTITYVSRRKQFALRRNR
jgi:hypothetical protein